MSKKTYRKNYNVGKCKYLPSYHDGEKTHGDGSPFFDVALFSNKKLFLKRERELLAEGYSYA